MLRYHKAQTEQHERRLRERFEALGRYTSARKEAESIAGASAKGVIDRLHGDKVGNNAWDGYVTNVYGDSFLGAARALGGSVERSLDRRGSAHKPGGRRGDGLEDSLQLGKFVELTLYEEGVPDGYGRY